MEAQDIKLRIATNVKRYRLERGFTQEYLAELAGLADARAVRRIENMEHSPTIETICKIAKAFDLDPGYLYLMLFNTDSVQELNSLIYAQVINHVYESGYY